MMAQFSPFTRRLIALAILFFLCVGMLNLIILPVASLVTGSLGNLADARFQLARLEAIKARPAPPTATPVAPGLYLMAPDEIQAAENLRAQLVALASQYQVRLETSPAPTPEKPTPGRIALTIIATGDQEAMLNFVNSLEQGEPLIRMNSWRLARDTGSGERALLLTSTPTAAQAMPLATLNLPQGFDPDAGAGVGGVNSADIVNLPSSSLPGQSAAGQSIRLDGIAVAAWVKGL